MVPAVVTSSGANQADGDCSYSQREPEHNVRNVTPLTGFPSAPQNKYKEEGKKEMSSSLYSQLPETAEMQLAKAVHEFQSEVSLCDDQPNDTHSTLLLST